MRAFLLIILALSLAIHLCVGIMLFLAKRRATRLSKETETFKTERERLSKWQVVDDADAKANEILCAATEMLEKAKAETARLTTEVGQQLEATRSQARNEADTTVDVAKQQAKKLNEDAQAVLSSSTLEASRILQEARKKAEEIAGDAYEAKQNAALYERSLKAMKNMIEGYGDQYLVPVQSLLDDLAHDFGHTQAGQELKEARERTKAMVQNGIAASCDYVEVYRRDTAVKFVVDAFNGKVDSILSRTKQDNTGTLSQEIQDAFAIVNFHGKAFRNARISDEYLAARLNELKWAVLAQQLRLEEREEQRRIKEQMREEERARREYERAMRDTAKEEEMLRKAMEKAQQQIERSSAEQKTKYEQQLQELGRKLKEAEERNQRAISMAQQTKRGHVYIISNTGSFGDNVYKIGLTRRLEPLDRIRELGDSSVPFEFDVHAMIFSEDAPALENQLHRHFLLMQMNKVNYRKEFFRVELNHVREEVDKLGLTASWTMTAEAAEYRQSLAVEKAIKEDPQKRESWIKRQMELDPIDENGTVAEPEEA